MNLQILVSTMHQSDHTILEKVNVNSDAIVVNQCDINKFEDFRYSGNAVKFISLAERGVGLSRNTSLMRATADVCLFADDDCTYVDNYKDLILRAFKEHTDADIIVFNVASKNGKVKDAVIKSPHKVRFYNALRYGTCRMAIKKNSIMKNNIFFSLLFGGGAKYSSGEDSLFIMDALKKDLNIYALPIHIGVVDQKKSTWFTGYDEKFLFDKGVLFSAISSRWSCFLCIQFLLRHPECYKENFRFNTALKIMINGANEYEKE